jgi:hypothetical protein
MRQPRCGLPAQWLPNAAAEKRSPSLIVSPDEAFRFQADRVIRRPSKMRSRGMPLPKDFLQGEQKKMANRRRFVPTVIVAALVALFLPVVASAQWGNNDRWGRDRNNGRYDNRYDNRTLRDAARRIDSRSDDFQRHLDSALDRSRYDDTRREDNINQMANEFRDAASRFRDRVGDGRDLNRSSNEAQRLLQLGSRMDRLVSRLRLDSRTQSDWSQIRQDLRVVSDFYGGRYNNGGYYGRDDDYYGNDRNRRRNDRRSGDEWWRRIPLPY